MNTGLRLTVTDTRRKLTREHLFATLPVRIGRNPLNDLSIQESFVSQFHCIVEARDGAPFLRDLGSRNGSLLGKQRAPAHEPVDLRAHNLTFRIGQLELVASLEPVDPRQTDAGDRRPLLISRAAIEDAQRTTAATPDGKPLPAGRAAALARVGFPTGSEPKAAARLRLLGDAMRAARERFFEALGEEAGSASDQERAELLEWARASFPGVQDAEELMALENSSPGESQHQLQYTSWLAVRELAAVLLPSVPPPATAEEVVRFLSRIRHGMDLFARCFVPLRDGHSQFLFEFDLRASHDSSDGPAAQDPRTLLESLLRWDDPAEGVSHHIESTFADVMIHQLALMDGVMRGIKALLQVLSPTVIEQALQRARDLGKTGFAPGPYRFKALWELYETRHADLCEGDKQAFSAVFGADFARAYSESSARLDPVAVDSLERGG